MIGQHTVKNFPPLLPIFLRYPVAIIDLLLNLNKFDILSKFLSKCVLKKASKNRVVRGGFS
jgi:hypothetical protein